MRVVRPTDNLSALVGHPQQPYHFAFTSKHGHYAGKAPTQDHLLVFFLPA